MKKLIVIALAVVLALSMVVVLAACEKEQVLEGECHYANPHGEGTYGVEVKVTVKGDRIVKVELVDHEGWIRTSADLKISETYGWYGYDETEAAYAQWLEDTFAGVKIETVKGWKAVADGTDFEIGEAATIVWGDKDAGETAKQSAARIIVAVQDALSKLDK